MDQRRAEVAGDGPEGVSGGGLTLSGYRLLAKTLGSGFRSLLLLCFKIATSDIIIIDEPESYLHPHLQEQLAEYLVGQLNVKQVIVATHSNVILNALYADQRSQILQFGYGKTESTPQIHRVNSDQLASLFDSLGVRPAQVLQANAVIWVEGPSDRIYVRRWIDLWSKGELREGRDYVCVAYGGRLLAHLSGLPHPEFLQVTLVNRNCVLLVDSDRRHEKDRVSNSKQRVIRGISENGGVGWLTSGREVENYIPRRLLYDFGLEPQLDDPFCDVPELLAKQSGDNRVDKVRVAREVAPLMLRSDIVDDPALKSLVQTVCEHLHRWNHAVRYRA